MKTTQTISEIIAEEACINPLLEGIKDKTYTACRLANASPELLVCLEGLHKALARMIDKHNPDSIEAEWLSHSNEVIRKATGKDIQYAKPS